MQLELTDYGSKDGFVMELWAMHIQTKCTYKNGWYTGSLQSILVLGEVLIHIHYLCVSRRPVMASNQVLRCFNMMGNGICLQDSLPTQSQCSLEP